MSPHSTIHWFRIFLILIIKQNKELYKMKLYQNNKYHYKTKISRKEIADWSTHFKKMQIEFCNAECFSNVKKIKSVVF